MEVGVSPEGVFEARRTAQAFTVLLSRGPMSRVDLARHTGMSQAAVTRALRPLLDGRFVAEGERPADRGAGRPALALRVREDVAAFVGVKITADEVVAVLTDLRAQIRESRHIPLEDRTLDAVVDVIASAVHELRDGLGRNRDRLRAVGLSVSGDTDPASGFIRSSAFLGWHHVPLAYLVQTATGVPTTLDNDVRALTVAEQLFGAGVGASSFVLITVGAGIGCGIVIRDRVIEGAHGVAGELGHLPIFPEDGPLCACGRRGCLEAIASDLAIARQARDLIGAEDLTVQDCLDLAHRGNSQVRDIYSRAGDAIGLGIASVANLIGPDRIILSGEGLAAYDLFEGRIRQMFSRHAFGAVAECDLLVRPLPFDEWARGAAAMAIQRTLITTT